jgi:hypothetical protein
VQQFLITIEGPGFRGVDEIELQRIPAEGDAIETKYGTCVVSIASPAPDSETYDGRIVCTID